MFLLPPTPLFFLNLQLLTDNDPSKSGLPQTPMVFLKKRNSWKLPIIFLFEHSMIYFGHDKEAYSFLNIYVLHAMHANCACSLHFSTWQRDEPSSVRGKHCQDTKWACLAWTLCRRTLNGKAWRVLPGRTGMSWLRNHLGTKLLL